MSEPALVPEHVPPDLAASMAPLPTTTVPAASESLFGKRLRKFRRLRRGYYSFILIVGAYLISFMLPLLANNIALVIRHDGRYYFPLVTYYPASAFGQNAFGDPDYRSLK